MVTVTAKPVTFSSGTIIQAAEVNNNFDTGFANDSTLATAVTAIESGALTITGNKTFSGASVFMGTASFSDATGATTDVITERTAGSGVTIDSLRIKDGVPLLVSTAPASPATGELWRQDRGLYYRASGTTLTLVPLVAGAYVRGGSPTWASVSTLTIPAGTEWVGDDGAIIYAASPLVVDITASGANGLDTGTEANGTWYYLWLASGASGTCGLLSTSTTTPTLPAGYGTRKARLKNCAFYNNASGDLLKHVCLFGWPHAPFWKLERALTDNVLLSGGTATSFTDVLCSAYLPVAITNTIKIYIFQNYTSASRVLYVRPKGETHDGYHLGTTSAADYQTFSEAINTDASGYIQYKESGAGAQASLYAIGWYGTEVVV